MHNRNFKHEYASHRNLIFPTGPVCEICQKAFSNLENLNRHVRNIHEKSSTSFSCNDCDCSTPRKSDLERHLKRHTKTSFNPYSPPKVARREPDSSTNHHLLDQNTQRGFGMIPADVPDKIRQFFQEERPWETDQNLRQIYVRNFHRIRDTETYHRRSRIFLRYLHHDRAPLIESIAHVLEDIFSRQTNAFKINLSFSFILQHRETCSSDTITPVTTTSY